MGLTNEIPDSEGEYELSERHSSVLLLGPDESKWAAYGFTNAESDDDSPTSDETGDPVDAEMNHGEETDAREDATPNLQEGDEDMYDEDIAALEDCLAADGGCDAVPQEHPIDDPRIYFLTLVDSRLRTSRKEWSFLVNKVVAGIRDQVSRGFARPAAGSDGWQNDSLNLPLSSEPFSGTSIAEKSVARLTKTISFLDELRRELQTTLRACERFLASKGDHLYFQDNESTNADTQLQSVIDSIRHSFTRLTDLERRLESSEKSCQKAKDSVSILTKL